MGQNYKIGTNLLNWEQGKFLKWNNINIENKSFKTKKITSIIGNKTSNVYQNRELLKLVKETKELKKY